MALTLAGTIAVTSAGCVLSSDRCGPNEMISGDPERCVCVPGTALTAAGCVTCGANEEPAAMGCQCSAGFVRNTAGACEAAPPAMGVACSASSPCRDATYNYCATSASGDGYCTTSGCAGGDCTGGYACDLSATPSYCKRPPTGLGMSCTASSDCAGTEATYCDTFQTHSCLVQGCTVSPNNCFEGWDCCDLSGFGVPMPICVAKGTCPQ
jgi:hypothetical protein